MMTLIGKALSKLTDGEVDIIKDKYGQPKIVTPSSEKAKIEKLANIFKDHALTCRRCDSLAIPAMSSGKIYRCLNCEAQFSNTKYDLRNYSVFDNRYINRAIQLLKDE